MGGQTPSPTGEGVVTEGYVLHAGDDGKPGALVLSQLCGDHLP